MNSHSPVQLLKHERVLDPVTIEHMRDEDEWFGGIRCPQCGWRPSPSSRWSCESVGTPEPPFASCGTTWNTFETRGRCPGCSHQWQWTSCLRCAQWSPHVDWYEDSRH